MELRTLAAFGSALALTAALGVACGGSSSPTTAIIPAPVSVATPAPSPTPTPADASVPPAGSGCGQPYPPPISRVIVKIHIHTPDYWTLDSTPQVGPDWNYCREAGFTDGRSWCPVRPEGHPERVACENWAVGKAEDTGRYGPTWSHENETWCTGPESGCVNHPDNQYQLNVMAGGWYEACVKGDVCGAVKVDR
jgi:hypothetical protein